MSGLEGVLALAALVAGLTGAWSPCGFSMVETVGLRGSRGGRLTSVAACATFAPGAMLGGAVTFGLLAAAGQAAHGLEDRLAYLLASAVAVAGAALEARGARIVPQIRRQLPESWRWRLPLPLASGLYGVLLGLGFTTFVLTFGVWALAAISFAVGDPGTGVAVGVAFGIGRALPVVLLAPAIDRPLAIRCTEAMAERPSLYRGFRLGDAAALALAAAVLAVSAPASATETAAERGADPSAAGRALAFQLPNQSAVVRDGSQRLHPPGTDPALGGAFAAVITGNDTIRILHRPELSEVGAFHADGADAVAVSPNWVAWRVSRKGHDSIKARNIKNPAQPRKAKLLGSVRRPAQLSAPSLSGSALVFASANRHRNAIVRWRLGTGHHGTVLSSRSAALSSPSVRGGTLLYVRSERLRQSPQATSAPRLRQSLMLKRMGDHGRGRRLYSRGGGGVLWSTSLTDKRAYATIVHGHHSKIIFARR